MAARTTVLKPHFQDTAEEQSDLTFDFEQRVDLMIVISLTYAA